MCTAIGTISIRIRMKQGFQFFFQKKLLSRLVQYGHWPWGCPRCACFHSLLEFLVLAPAVADNYLMIIGSKFCTNFYRDTHQIVSESVDQNPQRLYSLALKDKHATRVVWVCHKPFPVSTRHPQFFFAPCFLFDRIYFLLHCRKKY